MGIFQGKPKQHKTVPLDETSDGVRRFFEEYFQDLRSRGHLEFDEISEERKAQFKQDLDATVDQASDELRQHIADQLGRLFIENSKTMKQAQDTALQALTQSAEELSQRHSELRRELEKTVADQQATLGSLFADNQQQLDEMRQAQQTALESLSKSAATLQEQQAQLGAALQQQVAQQQASMVAAFEENMAQIIEHYLLEALGEQYDLKAQLPAIIKHMEANKQAITDDMKL